MAEMPRQRAASWLIHVNAPRTGTWQRLPVMDSQVTQLPHVRPRPHDKYLRLIEWLAYVTIYVKENDYQSATYQPLAPLGQLT
jgi:hypothetical protein